MGMTISEAISKMRYELNKNNKMANVYVVAIDTMRKYQKIQEIMNELNGNFYGSYLKDRQALEKIYKVVEDDK